MKKILFILIFQAFFISSYSQSRIGFTESQIKSEFYDWVFYSDYTSDYTRYIYTDTPEQFGAAYFFNSDGYCFVCFVKPKTQGYINYLVESFNKKYVIISDTEWKMYTQNGIVNIKLNFDDDGTLFIFSLNQ